MTETDTITGFDVLAMLPQAQRRRELARLIAIRRLHGVSGGEQQKPKRRVRKPALPEVDCDMCDVKGE